MAFKHKTANADNDLFSADEIQAFEEADEEAANAQQAEHQTQPNKGFMWQSKPDFTHPAATAETSIDSSDYERIYAAPDAEKARFAMDKRKRSILMLLILTIVVYVLAVVFPSGLFELNSTEPFATTFATKVTANLQQLARTLSGSATGGLAHSSILIYALAALVGAALATSGAAYQGSFQNDLASPSTLGVMSGASLGMVVYLTTNAGNALEAKGFVALNAQQAAQIGGDAAANSISDLSFYLMQTTGIIYSFIGALAVVALTVIISKIAGRGKLSNAGLVIAGQVFGALAGSVVTLYRLMLQTSGGQEAVSSLASLQTGDLTGLGNSFDALFLGIPVFVCIIILCLLAPKLNVVAFGADEARSMGFNVEVLRGIVIAISTLMTAIVVSYCGAIGFVGFLIPHMVRRLVGPDFRYLLPASAFAGAAFLIVIFYGYSCLVGYMGGIGLITTCVGAVVFFASIAQRRKISHAQN